MFEEIFSQKPVKIVDKIKIVVDHREKNSLVIAELVSLGFDLEFKQLPVADFLVNDTAIERKTVSDFISSMINKRLFNQLEEIKQYENHLLLIEGTEDQELYNESNKMNANVIRGLILSILLKYKVPIVFAKNYEDTAKFISVLAKKEEKGDLSLRARKKVLNRNEQIQYLLEGFPGIGPSTAKKLLRKYKTIKTIINTPLDELKKEIGKKSEIFSLLDYEFKED